MRDVVLIKLCRLILIRNCRVTLVLLHGLICWIRSVRLTGFVFLMCLVGCNVGCVIWGIYETCVVCAV
jgi:hypothetical protein